MGARKEGIIKLRYLKDPFTIAVRPIFAKEVLEKA
jgi:hypothetical protein